MPFVEVVGSVKATPLQIGPTCVNVGVVLGVMVTVIVAVVAHSPLAGVKVYVVVVVLLMAGDQVPSIPLSDVVGSVKATPLQIGPTCVNVGVVLGVMVTVIVAVVAHSPLAGVKV